MPSNVWPYRIEVRVTWRDTDAAGHANNSVFFTWMEMARTESFLAAKGKARDEPFEAHRDVDMILAHAECDFLSPAFMNETLVVETRPSRVGESSFALDYAITDKRSGRAVARGKSVQVAYDYAKAAKKPIAADLRRALEEGLLTKPGA